MFCRVVCREEGQRYLQCASKDEIECALEMVGMEFFNVCIATDDHNEDSFSVMLLKDEMVRDSGFEGVQFVIIIHIDSRILASNCITETKSLL